MRRRDTRILGAALSGLVMLVLSAGPASATHLFSLDKSEGKCRSLIAKGFLKAVATADKASAGCHKARGKDGSLSGVDCNDLNTPNQGDQKGKFAKAKTKLSGLVAKKCVGIDNDVRDGFVSCPEPCATDEGLSNPLADYDEVATCLGCVAGELVEAKNNLILGSPTSPLPGKVEQKCHAGIAKAYGKYLATILKSRTGCQKSADKDGIFDIAESGCDTDDSKGKIAKAKTKAEGFIDKFCGPVGDLSLVDSCDTTVANLKTCLAAETEATGDEALPAHYELEATICPVAVDSLLRSGLGFNSRLDIGWTGTAHNMPIVDRYFLSADLSCPGSEAGMCGDCTILGISSLGPQYQSFIRCSGTNPGVDDTTIECDEPFTLDPDCNGSFCAPYLGPPLPISAGNNPTCSFNRMREDITGTADPDSGMSEFSVKLKTRTFTGGTATLTRPCPVCLNDATPQDGVREGTCSGGSNNGGPCDTQGFDATFGPGPDEGFSLDCPPDPLSNITGDGLIINLGFTTQTTSLSAQNSCDSPLGILDCFCGVCTGDTALPCENDTVCSDAGAGSCNAFGSGVARQPNDCDTLTCIDQGTGEFGLCDGGPDDDFCSDVVRESGEGFLTCSENADCLTSECPGSFCGTCSLTARRRCFLDPIVETGVADPENPTIVTAFCLPPTISAAINGTTGVPGPARAAADIVTKLRY